MGIIPAMPFYSGLVMVIRKISVEKEDVNVFKTFVQAFRENLKKSIFNGFVAYLIVACSFFAILYYGTLAQTDIVYGSVFTIYIVFSIAMLIMLFYVPLLTITYDLRLRDIYKNSLLLIFGKILRNIVALVLGRNSFIRSIPRSNLAKGACLLLQLLSQGNFPTR